MKKLFKRLFHRHRFDKYVGRTPDLPLTMEVHLRGDRVEMKPTGWGYIEIWRCACDVRTTKRVPIKAPRDQRLPFGAGSVRWP